jgi:hypothetical protein
MKKILTLVAGMLFACGLLHAQAPQYGRFHKSLYGTGAPTAACVDGTLYYDTTNNIDYRCDGAVWVNATAFEGVKGLQWFDTSQIVAGGVVQFYIKVSSLTNALTGEQVVLRLRSENRVAGMTGALEGAKIQVANYEDSASGIMRGIFVEPLLKGKDINYVRGIEVNVDSDNNETIGVELAGITINMQTGSGQTYSGSATGMRISNAGVAGGGGKLLDSFIRLDSESNQIGATLLIDASSAKQTAQAGNVVCLMAFKDSNGTARYIIHDADSAAVLAVSATCP